MIKEQGDKMSKTQKHPKDHQARKEIARATKRKLTFVIALLAAIFLALMFNIGAAAWPAWLVASRTQIEGIIALAVILLIVLSPLIAEVGSNPRNLSGPGKNPEGPRLD